MSDLDGLAEQLANIAEQLDEMAFDQLREAVAAGAMERPTTDKRLMQARRAIEKAAHLLRSMDQGL
ncbi:MAG: hypothetical protein WA964_00495 [Ilumatobacter sp.]|uniref:hypothetical protein n=1 Tax=Ilumatobacter sp. TaxID=1967498 RepID=UPI003C793BF6